MTRTSVDKQLAPKRPFKKRIAKGKRKPYKSRSTIIIYDMTDKGLPVAVCDDYKEAASYLGISTNDLASNICRQDLIQYKYRAVRYTAKELENDKT
jgi:hypothetical protein